MSRTFSAKGGRDLVEGPQYLVGVHLCENGDCGRMGRIRFQIIEEWFCVKGDLVAGGSRMEFSLTLIYVRASKCFHSYNHI